MVVPVWPIRPKAKMRARLSLFPSRCRESLLKLASLNKETPLAEASLIEVLTASKDRVPPRCAHFGQCGGCHYQHAAYPAQVQMKVAILQETLERAGLTALPPIQAHTGEPWAYRNRTRLRIAELEATVRVGYNRRGSNEFLAIHECPISAPLVWRAAEALLHVAAENSAPARLLRSRSRGRVLHHRR